jgi:hypothetical protein
MSTLRVNATSLAARSVSRAVEQSQVAAVGGEVFCPSGTPIPLPPNEVAAALRELRLLDADCERLVSRLQSGLQFGPELIELARQVGESAVLIPALSRHCARLLERQPPGGPLSDHFACGLLP